MCLLTGFLPFFNGREQNDSTETGFKPRVYGVVILGVDHFLLPVFIYYSMQLQNYTTHTVIVLGRARKPIWKYFKQKQNVGPLVLVY